MRREDVNNLSATVRLEGEGIPPSVPDCCLKGKRSWRRWIAGLGLIALALASPRLSGAGGPITYPYDDLGRLVAVVDTSIITGTNAGVYYYDAVGNLTKIANNSATTVAIFAFSPNNGPVGQ